MLSGTERVHHEEIPGLKYEKTTRAFALKNPIPLFEYARAAE